jgi:hypothetical protein
MHAKVARQGRQARVARQPARPWTPGGKPSVNPTPCSGSLTKCPCAAGVSIFQPQATVRRACRKQTCAVPETRENLGNPTDRESCSTWNSHGIGSGQTSCQPGQVVEGCSWRASGRPAPQGPVHARNPGDTGLFTPGSPPFMHPAKLLRISYLSELLTERTGGEANAEVGPPAARTSSVPRGTD